MGGTGPSWGGLTSDDLCSPLPPKKNETLTVENLASPCGLGQCINTATRHECSCPDSYKEKDGGCHDIDDIWQDRVGCMNTVSISLPVSLFTVTLDLS